MSASRRAPHPLREVNPRLIDLGTLIDTATGDELGPATARHAADYLHAARRMGRMEDAVIRSPSYEPWSARARVEPPRYIDPITVAEWRLIVSIVLRSERAEAKGWK